MGSEERWPHGRQGGGWEGMESSPPRVHPGWVCTAVDSFDIKLTLPLDREKLTVFHNSNSFYKRQVTELSKLVQPYNNNLRPLCTSIKRTSISAVLMFASELGDPV